jgi:hypothetical protein
LLILLVDEADNAFVAIVSEIFYKDQIGLFDNWIYIHICSPIDATISSLITSAPLYVGIISVEHTRMNMRPA